MNFSFLFSIFAVCSALFIHVQAEIESSEEVFLTKQQVFDYLKILKKCELDSGAKPKYIRNSIMGRFKPEQKFKDYLYCLGNSTGFLDKEGNIDKKAFLHKTNSLLKDKKKAEKIVNSCMSQEADQPTAIFNALTCYNDMRSKI
ncbi:unnamed protein product [Diabrotica balteata]|uniref:Uncharacterized protein n=1 Tax=Diabrotica balteata TaxID=107213 RepID=A0A9N9XCR4_DIABA|nr:unnamed protein product [Diabrotica balteata]